MLSVLIEDLKATLATLLPDSLHNNEEILDRILSLAGFSTIEVIVGRFAGYTFEEVLSLFSCDLHDTERVKQAVEKIFMLKISLEFGFERKVAERIKDLVVPVLMTILTHKNHEGVLDHPLSKSRELARDFLLSSNNN